METRIALKKSCLKGSTTGDGAEMLTGFEMAHTACWQLELYWEDVEELLRGVNGLESWKSFAWLAWACQCWDYRCVPQTQFTVNFLSTLLGFLVQLSLWSLSYFILVYGEVSLLWLVSSLSFCLYIDFISAPWWDLYHISLDHL